MIVDRKYSGVLTKADGSVVNDWIVFRAKDALVPTMIEFYITQCRDAGCSEEHVAGMTALLHRIRAYQAKFPDMVKTPDTVAEDMVYNPLDDFNAHQQQGGSDGSDV